MKNSYLILFLLGMSQILYAHTLKNFYLRSPNGNLEIKIEIGEDIKWSVRKGNLQILNPSVMALKIVGGEILGKGAEIKSQKSITRTEIIPTPFYKKKEVNSVYKELELDFKGGFGLIFRAYDEGLAYRFTLQRKGEIKIESEVANFNFDQDYPSFIPYVRDLRGKEPYIQSFEALYTEAPLSAMMADTLGFLPVLISELENTKVLVSEADLENYPGMFISKNELGNGFKGSFAPFPLQEFQGGYNMINTMISQRAPYIALVQGTRNLPWRMLTLTEKDADLVNNDMVRKLASPSRVKDLSWIIPGKVAWDWWNDWNISHVDFRAGINTDTYKYYIDFASENHLEYIILDEGWSDIDNLMRLNPAVNLKELIEYGKSRRVSLILWASWYSVQLNMDEVFRHYSELGIKGFKVDFMDRDDQKMVSSLYSMAGSAAKNKLILDFHGMYKPTGMNHTFPNILNFEGVKGMENMKWTPHDDVPRYDVTLPFIRMAVGPMDYTPGAMRNATRNGFHPDNTMPMSQGTRCHQMAMYTLFEAPLQMLADNPTVYKKEQECTDFIAKVPTVFDETVAILGKVGEFIILARRKGNTWYIGAMTNWNAREVPLNLSFLGEGNYSAEIFQDGVNADRDATDYKKNIQSVEKSQTLHIKMAPGGGWTARLSPLR